MTNVDIVFEVPFLEGPIRKDHFAVAMLDTSNPLSNVFAPVCPHHLPMTLPFVFLVLSAVNVATPPAKLSLTTFFIINVLSCVLVGRGTW